MTSRPLLLTFGAVVAFVGWLGCASNDEPTGSDPGATPTPSSTTAKSDPTARPDFEAGFPENDASSLVDPTPDGGDTCVDKNDVGSNESLAKALPDTSDAQNDPITVNGVLNGAVDVDFYKFGMADTSFHSVGADLVNKTAGVEMCVFVKCKAGETTVSGCNGGAPKTSAIGTKGCCITGLGAANPNWDCPGFTDDDSADFFVSFKQTANKCTNYSWSYAF